MNTMEEWKDIKGYEGLYQVSNLGRVKRLQGMAPRKGKGMLPIKEHILKGHINNKHKIVELCGKPMYVHQLVAAAFIPNPNDFEVVHHIDFKPLNNIATNLIWMSDEEHRKLHSKKIGIQRSKKIYQYTIDGKLVKIWDKLNDAAKALSINQGSISNCASGKCKTYKGYKWSYEPL